MQEWLVLGMGKGVLFREVSSVSSVLILFILFIQHSTKVVVQ